MKKILFVDDEKFVLEGLRRSLRSERATWEMHFASGVDEALERLEGDDIDVVTTDVNMPGRDGFELLRLIRRSDRWADTPVIILTGNGVRGDKRRALDEGASDLLAKPVDREELIARIRSALRLRAAQETIKAQNEALEQRVRERTAELELSRAELIWRLARAGEFRDSQTGFHVVRVGFFAGEIARTLGLDEAFTRRIAMASPLHDIGKIGIPDQILLKPDKLDAQEWETMKTHTTIGGQILRSEVVLPEQLQQFGVDPAAIGGNPLSEMGAEIAENHHERWNGEGYPAGKSGEEIPLCARITSLADVFDALSCERPYKRPLDEPQVLALMSGGRGSQFDPRVFEAFESTLPRLREIRERFRDDADTERPPADLWSALSALAEAG